MSASRGSRLTFRHHFHYQRRDANGGIRAIRTQRPGPMAVERLAAPVLLGGTVRRERRAARFSASGWAAILDQIAAGLVDTAAVNRDHGQRLLG